LNNAVATTAYFTGDLIGFTTGLLLTILLLVLTLRAAKLPGTPVANIVFAVCALAWTAGGLARTALIASRVPRESPLALLALAVQFSGAAAFPIPILTVWRPFAVLSWQKIWGRILQICCQFAAGVILTLLWCGTFLGARSSLLIAIEQYTAYNATIFLLLGAVVCLRRNSTPGSIYLPSLVIVAAVLCTSLKMSLGGNDPVHAGPAGTLTVAARHLIPILILSAFFLFARFRFADVFIRYGVRILLAGLWATILALFAHSDFLMRTTARTLSPQASHVFGVILAANALLLSFTFADERISVMVNRWLFRPPDYRAAARQLRDEIDRLQSEPEITKTVEDCVRNTLHLDGALLLSIDCERPWRWPAEALQGEIVEFGYSDPLLNLLPLPNVEFLVPIVSKGRHVRHLLLVSPGAARPRLVTNDLNYLRTAAAQCGDRLDTLRSEQEAVERKAHEALLGQQVIEAELRALRSQVSPHFLFNSLNTIADLIVRDPVHAEEMTLRLAEVFRHVLANSSRSLTSVGEEIEFIRTYLSIEEARFRDRLQVRIDVAPEISCEHIPSLILQPLVENALKHGLGPKRGPGHLWISAHAEGEQLRLKVEDDGVGPHREGYARGRMEGGPPRPTAQKGSRPSGLGLTNVAERLKTLYRDQASIRFEPRESGGSCVTLLIPRGHGASPA
jgi:two-component system LytT family sensor kinase